MNQILAKRYAFCDFSSIVGFPNQVPARDEWENSLPRFRGEEWEVPAEHLLDFHDYMHRLQIVHEDVQIRLFCFSLEGIARDWYRSLPNASVSSLADFHVAFHVFCKDHFPADLLFPECCHEFNLSKVDLQEEYAAEENTLHHDHEVIDSPQENLSDAFDIISNALADVCCLEDEIVPSEKFEDVEQNDIPASDIFRSVEFKEDSLQFPDLQELSNLQLEQVNHDPECIDVAAACVISSPHLPDLQTKADFSINEENDGSEELNSPDQQPIVYVHPAKIQQSTFINEFGEGNEEQLQHSQSEQQLQEVFHHVFHDPIADWLDSFNSINIKIRMSEEGYLFYLLKPFFCMRWYLLLLGSRFSKILVNHNLTWLHWKSSVT
jgi:hypothetical protein